MKFFFVLFILHFTFCKLVKIKKSYRKLNEAFQKIIEFEKIDYLQQYNSIVNFKLKKLTASDESKFEKLIFDSDMLTDQQLGNMSQKMKINELQKQNIDEINNTELIDHNIQKYEQSTDSKNRQINAINMIKFLNRKQQEKLQEQKTTIKEIRYQYLKYQEELQIRDFEQTMKKQLKKTDQCNLKLMSAFGLIGSNVQKSLEIDTACIYNEKSCCTQKHIDSVSQRLQLSLQRINQKFDLIEMFLMQFNDTDFLYLVDVLFKDQKALDAIKKSLQRINVTKEQFVNEYLFQQLDKTQDLLSRLQFYRKSAQSRAENIVCTICNPNDNNFITEQTQRGLHIKYHSHNCQIHFDNLKFELDLIDFYQNFVQIIATAILAYSDKHDSKTLYPLNYNTAEKHRTKFKDCFNYFNMNDENCIQFCQQQHIIAFKFKIDIVETVKLALDIIFKELNDYELDQMLNNNNIYNVDELFINDKVYFFDRYNPLFVRGHYTNIKLELDDQNALLLRNNVMINGYIMLNSAFKFFIVIACFYSLIFN